MATLVLKGGKVKAQVHLIGVFGTRAVVGRAQQAVDLINKQLHSVTSMQLPRLPL